MLSHCLKNFARLAYALSISQKVKRLPVAIKVLPFALGFSKYANCELNSQKFDVNEENDLSHEFLIKQACTVSVNAATQLLTVTLVAIQDTSRRFREYLSNEICLVRQAMEWGEENTPANHWDQIVAVRGALEDLKHNIQTLYSYMEYAEKLASTSAEISYLSGNTAASDAICERIEQAGRAYNQEKLANQELQQESLRIQKEAILNSSKIEERLKQIEADMKLDELQS